MKRLGVQTLVVCAATVVCCLLSITLAGRAADPRGISQAACQARAGHLMKMIENWNKGGHRATYNADGFWQATGLGSNDNVRRLRLGQYLKFEDGVIKPIRSGREVALYQKIKEFIAHRQPNQRLGMDTLLIMGLDACSGSGGSTNLQMALLTIHNVVRILARPQQWAGVALPKDYGHPASDPAYPILQDVLGRSSTGGPALPDIMGVKRYPKGHAQAGGVPAIWCMAGLFDPRTGPFQPQPGANGAEWNGGCHYYYWIGALARTTLGPAFVVGGLVGEKGGKAGSEAQGTIEISQFVCGSIFGSEAYKQRNGLLRK